MPNLYPDVNQKEFLQAADKSLIRYGGEFMRDVFTRAHGAYVYTSDGQKILDFTSGQMSCLIGHGHPEVVDTITKHAADLAHLFSGMLSPPVIELAARLTKILPTGLDKAMFLSTGAESNEAAIKMAKMYTGKFEIVGLGGSWHGVTGTTQAASYKAGRKGYGPLMPGAFVLPTPDAYRSIFRNTDGSYDWETELNYGWESIDRSCTGSLAAVILEPILSSGGMLVLPPGYMQAMKAHCEKRGMLLIIDEAQTGLGRTGKMFAFQHDGVTPDFLTLSKTLGNGLPISATITSTEIEQTCFERGYSFYTTHVNDPLPSAVALKVLEVVERDGLVERACVMGTRLHAGLQSLKDKYGCVGDVRGRGLMAGVDIVQDVRHKSPAPVLGYALATRMKELGLSANISSMMYFEGTFRIAPPITVTEEELNLGLQIFERALAETPGTLPLKNTANGTANGQ